MFGSVIANCGVLILSVLGPKTAIEEGQNIFLITPSLAKFNTLNRDDILRDHARLTFSSAFADRIAAKR